MTRRCRVAGALALVTASAGASTGCTPRPATVVHQHQLQPGHLLDAASLPEAQDLKPEPLEPTTTTAPVTSSTVSTTEAPRPLQVPEGAAPQRAATTAAPAPSGALPPAWVRQRESGGNYAAVSPDGRYGGAWQFDQQTWQSVGGTGRAQDASPAEQDYRASLLWANGRGCAHWSAC